MNTRDMIGEQATLDGLISRTHTSFEEDGLTSVTAYAFYRYANLSHICLPNLVKCGSSAFTGIGITQLTTDMFPNMKAFESSAFSYCEKLETVDLNGVTVFGQNLFYYATNLRSVKLTAATKMDMRNQMFFGCTKLKELFLISDIMPQKAGTVFDKTPIGGRLGIIYVPRSMLSEYQENSSWNPYILAAMEDYPVTPAGTITDSWAEIQAAENDGTYLTKYSIHDTKYEMLGDHLVEFQIVAFDKDDLADGSGKAHITWLARTAPFQARMNDTNHCNGGWGECTLRSNLRDMLEASSSEFKSVVKLVNKTYYNGPTSQTLTIADTIWIPSAHEINLTSGTLENSGVVYDDVFSDDKSRIVQYFGAPDYYWIRTTNPRGYSSFRMMGTSGSPAAANISSAETHSVSPGFCT